MDVTEDQARFARRRVRRGRPRTPGTRPESQLEADTHTDPRADARTHANTDAHPDGETGVRADIRARAAGQTSGPATGRRVPVAETRPVPQPPKSAGRPPRRDSDRGERGLRGLVGSGPSQVGVSGALRARDAARPRVEDLRAADEELVVIRRHYVPPDRPVGAEFPGRTAASPGSHPGDGVARDDS